ncbi:hypothetical protein H5410_060937 [Solanum commersonii]|uniref:Uncharacterized protein n=1 Tax=Solanum commersonii TaxID=4109 RepID=A0A9J5W6D1_SOLCO|nr:hypothetical protein H5410_060937 [Solanum commersonii]
MTLKVITKKNKWEVFRYHNNLKIGHKMKNKSNMHDNTSRNYSCNIENLPDSTESEDKSNRPRGPVL